MNKTKLVFILSNDYGEYLMARYFIAGLKAKVVFLLPDNLYQTNCRTEQIESYKYNTLKDIMALLKQQKPKAVFLFSGYLFVINKILQLKDLIKLIDYLDSQRIKVVTSDPYQGLLNEDNLLVFKSFNLNNFQQKYNYDYYCSCYSLLKNYYHIYPAEITKLQNNLSFYNNEFISRNRENINNYWFFILSFEDFKVLAELNGEKKVFNIIKKRIKEAMNCKKQIYFISSVQIIDRLKQLISDSNIVWFPYCEFNKFINLLFAAEYVFSWNIISSSNLMRIIKKLPIIFLARGHMEYYFKPVYEKGLKLFYNNKEPQIYPVKQILSAKYLKVYAKQQINEILKKSSTNKKRLPKPQNILKKLFI